MQSLEWYDSEPKDSSAASGKGKEQILPWALQKESAFLVRWISDFQSPES